MRLPRPKEMAPRDLGILSSKKPTVEKPTVEETT